MTDETMTEEEARAAIKARLSKRYTDSDWITKNYKAILSHLFIPAAELAEEYGCTAFEIESGRQMAQAYSDQLEKLRATILGQ